MPWTWVDDVLMLLIWAGCMFVLCWNGWIWLMQ